MNKIFKSILAAVLALSLTTVALPASNIKAEAASSTIVSESFENEKTLENWSASADNKLLVSDLRAKEGSKSGLWEYTPSGSLTFKNSHFADMVNNKSAGIIVWIYNEQAKDENLTFTIGTESEVDADTPRYRFTFNLNFTGWRTLHLRVYQDGSLDKTKSTKPDTMRISMPDDISSGRVFIDLLEINSNISFAYTADYQAPYITNVTNEYRFSLQKPKNTETEITDSQIADFDLIEEKLDNYVFPTGVDYASLEDSPIKTRYQKLTESVDGYISSGFDKKNIKRESDGRITGPGLFAQDDARSPKFSDFETTWIALLADYKLNHDETSKEKLFLLFDYFADQGWAFGSALGTLNHQDNRNDGYAYAMYIMREELAETGRLQQAVDALGWYSLIGMIFDYDPQAPDYVFNTDSMRTSSLYQLMCILSMPDSPEKVTYMKYYVDFMSKVIIPKLGLRGGLKPDGTTSHHNGVYMAGYGSSCTYILSQIAYLLNGTQFELSKEATDTLKNVLTTYFDTACDYDLPYGVRGRFPTKSNTLVEILGAYAFFTLCGDKDMSEKFLYLWKPDDTEISYTFKRWTNSINYTNTLGELVIFEDAFKTATENGYTEKAPQEKTFVKPYGGYMIHRKDNWMLSVKGFSKYVWDYESDNGYKMGRYNGYGSTFIFTDDNNSDDLDFNSGWNWTRWPGTTTIAVSNDELIKKYKQSRNFSNDAFLGGVSNGNNGVYSMSMQDRTFDKSFKAKKSWFCFGDEIVCLGSGIENADKVNDTQTTLFQTPANSQNQPLYTSFENGKAAAFPSAFNGADGKSEWILDTASNGYIIPNSSELKVEYNVQESVDLSGKRKTSGNYATAYFNHGKAPENANYQYVIVPQTTVQELEQKTADLSYEVVKQDDFAHIVNYKDGQKIGYSVFNSETDDFKVGALKSVSAPCVVMEEKNSPSEMYLTVSDPDLRVVDTATQKLTYETEVIPSQEKTLCVTLDGLWNVENNDSVLVQRNLQDNTTTLSMSCSDGEQYALKLSRSYENISITVNPENLALTVGEEKALSAEINIPEFKEKINWMSDDENVVKVDENGNVKAVGSGTAKIKAYLSSNLDCYAVCTVTVNEPKLNITVNDGAGEIDSGVVFVKLPSVFTLYKNASVTLGYSLTSNVKIENVEWSYANWSQTNPEAYIEPSADGTAVIRPNSKGVGARSVWVNVSVTDELGNVYSDTVKVRFYKFDWQR